MVTFFLRVQYTRQSNIRDWLAYWTRKKGASSLRSAADRADVISLPAARATRAHGLLDPEQSEFP